MEENNLKISLALYIRLEFSIENDKIKPSLEECSANYQEMKVKVG